MAFFLADPIDKAFLTPQNSSVVSRQSSVVSRQSSVVSRQSKGVVFLNHNNTYFLASMGVPRKMPRTPFLYFHNIGVNDEKN